ncbi:MAG: DUF6249 domain-containing protein [Limisphaerales bacterium]
MNHEILGILGIGESGSALILLVPIVAIVMSIGMVMLLFTLNYLKRKHMFSLYHQERMAAIEKGVELPPLPDAFFSEETKGPGSPHRRSPHRRLLTGLILLALGLSMMAALYIDKNNDKDNDYIYGIVPAAIGLAFLLFYFTAGKKEAEVQAQAAELARLAEKATTTAKPSAGE